MSEEVAGERAAFDRSVPEPEERPAGFGIRVAARLIDGTVVFILMTLVGEIISAVVGPPAVSVRFFAIVLVMQLTFDLAYDAIGQALAGATLGKALLGLRVRSIDRGPCSPIAAIARNLFVPLEEFAFPITYWAMWRSPLRQRISDQLAGTMVVHVSPRARKDEHGLGVAIGLSLATVIIQPLATRMLVDLFKDTSASDASASPAAEATSGSGCADGTREGLNGTTSANVAACAGAWNGDVSSGARLCATGWHVCTGAEPAMKSVLYADATSFPGCFAFDAAQDNYVCHPGCRASVASRVDSAANIDMGGLGRDCPWKFPGARGCIGGGRIDASENSGTGCLWRAGLTGVACCH